MGRRGHVGMPEEWEPFPHFNRQGGLQLLLAKPQRLGAHFSVSQRTQCLALILRKSFLLTPSLPYSTS